MSASSRASRCLVVAPNWVGDTVMSIPALDSLAATSRRLSVLAAPHLAPLLRLVASVDSVTTRPTSNHDTIECLRGGRFDEVVVLPNSFRSAWLAWKSGIASRWGYRGDFRSLLLRPAIRRPPRSRHQVHDYDSLLEQMGAAPASSTPHLEVSEHAEVAARAALHRAGIDPDMPPRIGLFIGAEFGPSKRWPTERFAETARRLRRIATRARPMILAGPGEAPLAASLHHSTNGIFPVLGPDLDLAELAGLLSLLDVLVTNDSGPMHLAAAVGTPCVAIFGPTNPIRTAPSGHGHRVLYRNRWCSPCFRRRCPLVHHRCLREIGVDEVTAACSEILSTAGYSIS